MTASDQSPARRAIVLGGGISALTAAYHLSQSKHFEHITVYQQGWRLGGKAASGRDQKRYDRIEEHGLHIWFGYYENAFRLLAACHEELDRIAADDVRIAHRRRPAWQRWSSAMTMVAQGFHPVPTIGLADDEPDGRWTQWLADFPVDDDRPWDRDSSEEPVVWDLPWYLERIGTRSVQLLGTALQSLVQEVKLPLVEIEVEAAGPRRHADAIRGAARLLESFDPVLASAVDIVTGVFGRLRLLAALQPDDTFVRIALAQIDALDSVTDYIRVQYDRTIRVNPTIRRSMIILDLFFGVTRGLLSHRVVSDADLDALDSWEWDAWLAAQGVRIETRESSLVRGLSYSLPFAFVDGRRDDPSFSAGVGLRLFLRTFFTYRGALMWKANAGFGDIVFAPLFELLVKRGVEFQFFHRVVDLDVDGDEEPRITAIHLRRQQEGAQAPSAVRPPTEESLCWYRDNFLVAVTSRAVAGSGLADGDLMCWPSRPLVEEWCGPFDDEALLGVPRDAGEPVVVPVEHDDVVVFGLPLGVVPFVGRQLLQSPRWAKLVEQVQCVPTQSAQLWLKRSCQDALGWPDDVVASGFSEPFDTFADMPTLAAQEGPGMKAKTTVYLCGVLSDAASRREHPKGVIVIGNEQLRAGQRFEARQEKAWLDSENDLVREGLLWFLLERAGVLWPSATAQVASALSPPGRPFDPSLLADPDDVVVKALARMPDLFTVIRSLMRTDPADVNRAAPYWRANVQPSDRYVLSLPGTAHWRLPPGDSGFANLLPVGDWTACVLNAGCMEAATISGMLAAEAILGIELAIVGRRDDAVETGPPPAGPKVYWSTA